MSYFLDVTVPTPVPIPLRLIFLWLPTGDPGIPRKLPPQVSPMPVRSGGFCLFLDILHEEKPINGIVNEDTKAMCVATLREFIDADLSRRIIIPDDLRKQRDEVGTLVKSLFTICLDQSEPARMLQ